MLLDRGQDEARTLAQVAEATLLTSAAVGNIKRRYFSAGLDTALHDRPRTGRPVSKMTGDVEAHLIALTCSEPPAGYDQWTLRLLAEGLVSLEVVDSMSHVTVGKTLKKMNSSLGK